MADRKYYVLCESNCKFESMTKEQIIAAIAEATGATVTDVDAAFITKIKEQNSNADIKIWVGTEAEYNAIVANGTKDANTIYFTTTAITPPVDGYTPQKGVDYWTPEDKDEIVDYVLNSVPNANGVSF